MRIFLTLFGILLLTCLSPLAQAERLRIVSDDWAPYIYQENGQPRGLHYEVANEVFKRLHIDVEWGFMPWKRCLAVVEQGQADGILGVFKLASREPFMLYPEEPLSQVEFVLFQARARPHSVTTLQDLSGLTVGTSSGYDYGSAFDTAVNFRRESAPTHVANLGKLALGRVDLVVTDRHVGRYLLQRLGLEQQIEALPMVVNDLPQYLGLARKPGREALAEAFSETLRAFKREPAYAHIMSRYGEQNPRLATAVEQQGGSTR
ncbi:substrate-binding periplasmic protein [Pseudomonas phoenicis]|uniref:substrate-binding periplasmic protein n=1 Tax=unclassified Pseudomonas TaxID=196821 RepID=UPI00399F6375